MLIRPLSAEVFLQIVCGCIPAFKPLYDRYFGKRGQSKAVPLYDYKTGSKSRYTPNGGYLRQENSSEFTAKDPYLHQTGTVVQAHRVSDIERGEDNSSTEAINPPSQQGVGAACNKIKVSQTVRVDSAMGGKV